jgi:TDG/mug DNA glycosylase family protein
MTKELSYQHLNHQSIAPFYDADSRILILGSFPSAGSRKAGFYFAYPTNRFFKVLALLFTESEPIGTENRKAFLARHHIALFDVISECDIHASSDSTIKNVIVNDFTPILKTARIQAIFTTGSTAHQLYETYVGKGSIALPSSSAANASLSLAKLVEAYRVILKYL